MSEQQFWTKFFQSQYFLQKSQQNTTPKGTQKKSNTTTTATTTNTNLDAEKNKDKEEGNMYTNAHCEYFILVCTHN